MRKAFKNLLIWSFSLLRQFGLNRILWNSKKDNVLRVLLFHDIAPNEIASFSEKIDCLSKDYNFVTPNEFEAMMEGTKPIIGKNLLLTFDDGFKSNIEIATQILDKKDIKAIFFIVADFADLSKIEDCRNFISENIYPAMLSNEIPNHWENMNWHDLRYLVDNGHFIGCHTKTHARLSTVSDPIELAKEILKSTESIERKLNINVTHFAYPFGDLKSFSGAALNIAKTKFQYIHSGFRGRNEVADFDLLVLRDSVSGDSSVNEMLFYLDGWVDAVYISDKRKFRAWLA
jgi:peptidoglycan/xylan/chitin deacetylase (PgdA/CDA1 family)